MIKAPPYRHWFIRYSIYNLLFFSFQLSYLNTQTFISPLPLPGIIYIELLTTLLIHIGLYLLLSAMQTLLMWGLAQQNLTRASLKIGHFIIWSLTVFLLLVGNSYFFPLSRFSLVLLRDMPTVFILALLLVPLTILTLLMLNMLFWVLKKHPKISLGSSFMFCILVIENHQSIPFSPDPIETKTPNIILIGIDSLDPKQINAKNMPTVTAFMQQSVFFQQTITPLARTYPSWSSILTGLYPEHHHNHYNLTPPELVTSNRSLAWDLQKAGYQTLLATDERRFSSIGKEFGFQTIIGPKVGANDILMSVLNDFPLSNFLINLPIGHWAFPYNHMNRASNFSYYPATFDKAIQNTLVDGHSKPPIFIAIHFTLAHWPYTWATSSPNFSVTQKKPQITETLYQLGLHQVDQQIAHVLDVLQHRGYLDNSMLILLSDHGEAIPLSKSRQTTLESYQGPGASQFVDYLKRKTSTAIDESSGHGSDLLSPNQYNCLLAFKIYQHGGLITRPKIINTRVALIDIAPTIYHFLSLIPPGSDGVSLLTSIIHKAIIPPDRFFIMESGMLANKELSPEKALFMAKKFLRITPKLGHLQISKDKLSALDADKLYAIIEGNWVLALYPDDRGYIPITLHLTDGKWTDELNSDFGKKSPAISMLKKLNQFYNKKRVLSVAQSP